MKPEALFIVAYGPGHVPTLRRAELVGMTGSWWHVKHANGSVSKHNGGAVGRHTTAVGHRYEKTMVDAYAGALSELIMRAWYIGYSKDGGSTEQLSRDAGLIVEDCAEQMFALGKLVAQIEGSSNHLTPSPTDDKHKEKA